MSFLRPLVLLGLCALSACSGGTTEASEDSQGLARRIVDGTVLEPHGFYEHRVALLIPQEFERMGDELLAQEYPAAMGPDHVFTDASNDVNVTITFGKGSMTPEGHDFARQILQSALKKGDPTLELIASDLRMVNGREWYYVDSRGAALDGGRVRNMIMGTSLEGSALIVSANMTRQVEDSWVERCTAILSSVSAFDA